MQFMHRFINASTLSGASGEEAGGDIPTHAHTHTAKTYFPMRSRWGGSWALHKRKSVTVAARAIRDATLEN